MSQVEDFWGWFDKKRADLTIRQVEMRAGCPRGRIGNAYQKRIPTASVCSSIADGLGLSTEEILQQAGHITTAPQDTTDRVVISLPLARPAPTIDDSMRTFLSIWAALTPERQQNVIEYTEWQLTQQLRTREKSAVEG